MVLPQPCAHYGFCSAAQRKARDTICAQDGGGRLPFLLLNGLARILEASAFSPSKDVCPRQRLALISPPPCKQEFSQPSPFGSAGDSAHGHASSLVLRM
ncbi:hypothetical protein GOP47_0008766 [Adiantum capillus-veneris]|uniref:Uncharacterized protein n=1 Tax=Adiantum capillus-veneris TaxID=13818 RepID=A0A9D4UZH7_ADICA|nr:hypothetical protein GOP47_0008766 [Adiantum capillus-veneris]